MSFHNMSVFICSLALITVLFAEDNVLAFGRKRPSYCKVPTIQEIKVPLFPDRAQTKHVTYQFDYRPPASSTVPTVVYILGGPGQSAISNGVGFYSAPDEFGAVLIDPRGVGCNETPDFLNDSSISSEFVADDIVEVVRGLHLNNYIIYGISYGTAVGTIVASKVESAGLPKPSALVFDGVLGRAFENEETYMEYSRRWDSIYQALPANVRNRLNNNGGLPFGFSGEQWGTWLANSLLSQGINALVSTSVYDALAAGLSDQASAENQESLRLAVLRASNDLSGSLGINKRFYEQIGCNEIFPAIHADPRLSNGALDFTFTKRCQMTHPFDSAKWAFTSPVYYFSGEIDVATPMWQAEYHLLHHSMASRWWIKIPDGGHGSIAGRLMSCAKNIWASIAKASDLQHNQLAFCERDLPISVQHYTAD